MFGQVVGNDKQRLLTKTEAFTFHSGGDHFKGLACAHFVCKQGVPAVENVSNGTPLMFTELDFGVHTAEHNMRAVVLTGTVGIEKLVVLCDKLLSSVRVSPNPILERIFDCLLLLLCKGRFLGVQHTSFLAVGVSYGVIDTNITQIQSVLQNLVGVGSVRAVGHIGVYVAVGRLRFTGDVPLCRERRVVHFNASAKIIRRLKGLHHKLLNIGLVNPRCTEAYFDFRGIQVFGLCHFKSFHIVGNLVAVVRIFGKKVKSFLIVGELFTDVTGEEIISSTPSIRAIGLSVEVHIDNATQIACEFIFALAGQRGHILHIHTGFLCDRNCQSFRSRVNRGHDLAGLNGTLGEHIRFSFEVVVLVENFQ